MKIWCNHSGPYKYSEYINYCTGCAREITDWFCIVASDLKQVWYGKRNKKYREAVGHKNP